MNKKILIIQGNTTADSFSQAILENYKKGALQSGHEVKTINIGELHFDPILHNGYKEIQNLEADLLSSQELITWSDHLVVIFPTWWGSTPAILKGFFDRAFIPGFAFKYIPNSRFWNKLLKGRSARIITTMDGPSFYYKYFAGAPGIKMMKKSILEFCGFSPVKYNIIGSLKFLSQKQKEIKLQQIFKLGTKAK